MGGRGPSPPCRSARFCGRQRACDLLDGLDDVHVARAAAEVAADPHADLRLRWLRVVGEQPSGLHDHAGGAGAALVPPRPPAWTASIVQDLALSPFTCTVQAPQLLVSQPIWVPVRPKLSRSRWTRRSRGSTSASRAPPLTLAL